MPAASSFRVWLTCATVAAAVVAAVLLLTRRPDAEANGPKGPPPPPALTEQEIRTYLIVKPREKEIMQDAAMQYVATRRAGQVDDPAIGEKAQARVDAVLQGQHLTQQEWQSIRDRVERVVNLMRAEAEFPAAKPDIEKRLALRKDSLKGMGSGDPRRAGLELEIRNAEALLANGPPKVSEEDRALALRFWSSLSEVASTIGPAPQPRGEPAPQPGK